MFTRIQRIQLSSMFEFPMEYARCPRIHMSRPAACYYCQALVSTASSWRAAFYVYSIQHAIPHTAWSRLTQLGITAQTFPAYACRPPPNKTSELRERRRKAWSENTHDQFIPFHVEPLQRSGMYCMYIVRCLPRRISANARETAWSPHTQPLFSN